MQLCCLGCTEVFQKASYCLGMIFAHLIKNKVEVLVVSLKHICYNALATNNHMVESINQRAGRIK